MEEGTHTQLLPRILTGTELVKRSRCAKETPLPEVGLKEVTPDGSWLEAQKIKAALEARKALLAVERIDKMGSLSHAEWRDSLRLAEVTKGVGGYWLHMGHKVNHTMYLRPEEALYLIETNCLLLRHNSVTVSFQKAYKLLLDDEMPLTKYKVYASLSRLGYKVLRHEKRGHSKLTDPDDEMLDKQVLTKDKESINNPVAITLEDAKNNPKILIDEESEKVTVTSNDGKENSDSTNTSSEKSGQSAMPSEDEYITTSSTNCVMLVQENEPKELSTPMEIDQNGNENIPDLSANGVTENIASRQSEAAFTIDGDGVIRVNNLGVDLATIDKKITSNTDTPATDKINKTTSYSQHMIECYKAKYQKILNRKFKPLDPQILHEKFKNIPDLSKQQIVTIKVPSEDYLPRNIFLNNTSYVLNLETMRVKPRRSSVSNAAFSSSPCLRIRNSRSVSPRMHSQATKTPQFAPRVNTFPQAPRPQRPFAYSHFGSRFEFPNMFQRPLFYNFMPMFRFGQYYTNYMHNRPRFPNTQNQPDQARKRQYENMKSSHLNVIKDCAQKLKQFQSPPQDSITSLKNLVVRFNEIYQERMVLKSDFDIIDSRDENIPTIDLDDDDDVEVVPVKQRKEDEIYEDYLKNLKELAATFKDLKRKSQHTSKQKRAFLNLIKNFNNAYATDYYLDSTGEVVDRTLIVLDSSSDTDVVNKDDAKTKKRKRKMVRNPFHEMKKLKVNNASTSKADEVMQSSTDENPIHMDLDSESIVKDISKGVEARDRLLQYFDEKWLPNEDDFGKALPCSKADAQLLDIISFDDDITENNWSEAKMKACYRMESHFQFFKGSEIDRSVIMVDSNSKPLIGTDEDKAYDSFKIWENLRIIPTNTDVEETTLRVDFDVYNRDVQNFKKTEPPIPHFRIVCVDESSPFPSGAEVRALQSNYNDNVSIIFAVVGVGSISYLQLKPTELPIILVNE